MSRWSGISQDEGDRTERVCRSAGRAGCSAAEGAVEGEGGDGEDADWRGSR